MDRISIETGDPNDPADLEALVKRNVRALVRVRDEMEAQRSLNERIADAVTAFAGTMWFAYLHAFLFGSWILLNSALLRWFRPFDPFPFVMLAMFASVEAIFLSTFVLVSQNRAAKISERHAELDLQVNLLAERELTELLQMVEAIARRLQVPVRTECIEPLKEGVSAEKVLEHIEDAKLAIDSTASR